MFLCAGMEGREVEDGSVKGLSVRTRAWNDPLLSLGNISASAFAPSADLLSVLPSFSSVDFRYDMRHEDTPMLMQEGDGLQQGSFNAESFLRLDGKSSVAGGMSYQRGEKSNVLWNETSDFDILFPMSWLILLAAICRKNSTVSMGDIRTGRGIWYMLLPEATGLCMNTGRSTRVRGTSPRT